MLNVLYQLMISMKACERERNLAKLTIVERNNKIRDELHAELE
jgi:hypothetical protein